MEILTSDIESYIIAYFAEIGVERSEIRKLTSNEWTGALLSCGRAMFSNGSLYIKTIGDMVRTDTLQLDPYKIYILIIEHYIPLCYRYNKIIKTDDFNKLIYKHTDGVLLWLSIKPFKRYNTEHLINLYYNNIEQYNSLIEQYNNTPNNDLYDSVVELYNNIYCSDKLNWLRYKSYKMLLNGKTDSFTARLESSNNPVSMALLANNVEGYLPKQNVTANEVISIESLQNSLKTIQSSQKGE